MFCKICRPVDKIYCKLAVRITFSEKLARLSRGIHNFLFSISSRVHYERIIETIDVIYKGTQKRDNRPQDRWFLICAFIL